METVEFSESCSACWLDGGDIRRKLFLCTFNSQDFGDVIFWVWLLLFLLLSYCNAAKVIFSKRGGSIYYQYDFLSIVSSLTPFNFLCILSPNILLNKSFESCFYQ